MQLRVYNDISESVRSEVENIIDENLKEYIRHMRDAYSYFHEQNYDSTLNSLSKISSFYAVELLVERDMLTLACYSKKLATDDVVYTINKLERMRNSVELKNEKEMRERLGHLLVTACAHTGEISKAREIEDDVAKSILPRCNIDESANERMHVIMRNANAIHGIDVSPSHVKRALNFFGKANGSGTHRNIRQYYTSIINYSAVLTMDGKFDEAHIQTLQGLNLEREYGDIRFPRPQILRSNFILTGVLTKKIEPQKAINMYADILSFLPKNVMAEKLFYTSNQSVLYALINQPKVAYDILSSEALNHDIAHDKEGLYKYHVVTNCAIYSHLAGRTEDAIRSLKEQSHSLKKLVNCSYFIKKNELLIEAMENNYTTDGLQWLDAVHALNDSFQGTPWNYFGLGYAFIALCDWGV
jgi:tetratricopeptide (TPR) repeat protein